MLPSNFLIEVNNHCPTKSLTGDFTSLKITSLLLMQTLSIRRLSCPTFGSSLAPVATSLDHGLLSSLSADSHADIGTSSFSSVLALLIEGS